MKPEHPPKVEQPDELHLSEDKIALMRKTILLWDEFQRRDTERPGSSDAMRSLDDAEEAFRGLLTKEPAKEQEGPNYDQSPITPTKPEDPIQGPERIWLTREDLEIKTRQPYAYTYPLYDCDIKYTRSDLVEAQAARVKALEDGLRLAIKCLDQTPTYMNYFNNILEGK